MKYYYLFILIVGLALYLQCRESELNKEQGKQIDSLIITTSNEEKGIANKADVMMANVSYYLGKLYDKTTPMLLSNQFVKPVLKYGLPGKEPEYDYHNESPRLGLNTSENQQAVILNRSKKLAID